ncbi:WRKY DNA-binding protein 70 [Rhynchospora pubera]|uniref:WRKY DNA-binding protein 70 n=1 Tax=Rhynchospora pubera TaxID=906938 RepID=A0AAV8ELN1_9POAL|nr:WRKY DNA-binding protein 70 [Rhynchospora pubera]
MEVSNSNNFNLILKDLLKGQESAHRLSNLVNGSEEVKGLMGEILDTFSRVIPALQTSEAVNEAGLTESADPKSEISKKKRKGLDGSDQRTGSRRSVRQASTQRVIQTSTIEDGHLWRKYGQKEILNSKHPRSYYRCTHKYDQGCKAQKHVQRSEEDPTVLIISYTGHHTCKSVSSPTEIIQSFSHNNSSRLISFESNTTISNNNKPGQENKVSTSVQSLKQDGEEEVLSNVTMADWAAGSDSEPVAPILEQGGDGGDVTSDVNWPSTEDLDIWDAFELSDLSSFADLIR